MYRKNMYKCNIRTPTVTTTARQICPPFLPFGNNQITKYVGITKHVREYSVYVGITKDVWRSPNIYLSGFPTHIWESNKFFCCFYIA